MKRLIFLGLAGLMFLSFSGCGSKMGGQIKGDKVKTEGWLDDDTYQVIAWGEASPDVVGEARWRNQAKEGAQMMAEKRIMEKFKGYSLEAQGYTEEGGNVMVTVTKDVAGVAKGGEIVQTTFDKESRAAEIVYRVHGRNLKRRVENGFQVGEIEEEKTAEEDEAAEE
ncbi:MAG: hypothetical protein PF545_04815 [Elusimicrobia bacterium]|jgi:hypothetical protein|nr:hypothetical protein [Elusimicrobiota bacterium]